MFQKILVPVDFTEKNHAALETAASLVRRSGGELILLHVIEELDLPFEEVEDFYARLETEARKDMDGFLGRVVDEGVPASGQVTYGKRAPEIVEFAETRDVELVVMTSHRVSPRKDERFMTISHQVAIFAPCPVLLLR